MMPLYKIMKHVEKVIIKQSLFTMGGILLHLHLSMTLANL